MPQDYIVSVPLEELKKTLSEAVKDEIKLCLSELQAPKSEAEYITRKEAASILRVSLPTLSKWTQQGLLKGKRIGSRVRYLRSEVENSLNSIKTFNSGA